MIVLGGLSVSGILRAYTWSTEASVR